MYQKSPIHRSCGTTKLAKGQEFHKKCGIIYDRRKPHSPQKSGKLRSELDLGL